MWCIGELPFPTTARKTIMYDLSQPNDKPGACIKCRGTGVYSWGANVNGKSAHSGPCYSCRGTGKQSDQQIRRNHTYNKHKIAAVVRADMSRDPGFVDLDRMYEDSCSDICGR
jgi:excinuclease UvrABC ATPase subunit